MEKQPGTREVREIQVVAASDSQLNDTTTLVPSFELFQQLQDKVKHLEEELGSLRDTLTQYTDHRAKGGQ